MEIFNPKEELRIFLNEYRLEPKGYYYLSGYSNKLLRLIEKCSQEVDTLYFIKLDLEDFINDDLEEVLNADINSRTYKLKFNSALDKLSDIKNDFFKHIENNIR